MSTKWKATLASAVGALLVMAAAAQSPANSVIEGMAANNKQLRQYTYKQRSETYQQGELKNTTVDEIHYNPLGERVGISHRSTSGGT